MNDIYAGILGAIYIVIMMKLGLSFGQAIFIFLLISSTNYVAGYNECMRGGNKWW